MSEAPAFSVVVPAYNSGERLAATLASALGQTRSDLELIVVDDGSSDDTATVADRVAAGDGRVRVIRQENAGTAAARNAGLAVAGGRFVSFLDDDDLWLPRHLELAAVALDAQPGAGLAHCDAWVVDAATGRVAGRTAGERFPLGIRRPPAARSPEETLRALLRVNFLTTCAVTVRREAIERVGPLDPAIRGSDDWDLWLRIAGAGFGSVRVPGAQAVLRKRSDSAGSDAVMMARNSAQVLRGAIERTGDPAARRIAARHLRVVEAEVAALDGGSRPRRKFAGAARRLGRKRLSPRPGGGWHQPEGELAALLSRTASRSG